MAKDTGLVIWCAWHSSDNGCFVYNMFYSIDVFSYLVPLIVQVQNTVLVLKIMLHRFLYLLIHITTSE